MLVPLIKMFVVSVSNWKNRQAGPSVGEGGGERHWGLAGNGSAERVRPTVMEYFPAMERPFTKKNGDAGNGRHPTNANKYTIELILLTCDAEWAVLFFRLCSLCICWGKRLFSPARARTMMAWTMAASYQ